MEIEIKHKISGEVLFKCEAVNISVAVDLAIKAEVDLRYANLSYANLSYANLSYADLRSADLRSADLSYADLSYADLDFSVWPLWCGSKKVKVDIKFVYQLLAHICVLDCKSKFFKTIVKLIKPFALKSHRANDLGVK